MSILHPILYTPGPWKSNLFIGDGRLKRDTLSLLVPNIDHRIDPKAFQRLFQSSNDELSVLYRKMTGGVGHFRAVPLPMQPPLDLTTYTVMWSSVRGSFACGFCLIWGSNKVSNALGRRRLGQPHCRRRWIVIFKMSSFWILRL